MASERLEALSILTPEDADEYGWMLDFYQSLVASEGIWADPKSFNTHKAEIFHLQLALQLALGHDLSVPNDVDFNAYNKTISKYGSPFFWDYKRLQSMDLEASLILVTHFLHALKTNDLEEQNSQLASEVFDNLISNYNA